MDVVNEIMIVVQLSQQIPTRVPGHPTSLTQRLSESERAPGAARAGSAAARRRRAAGAPGCHVQVLTVTVTVSRPDGGARAQRTI